MDIKARVMSRFVHPAALCESDNVGESTRIWAFAHVMYGARVGRDCNIGDGAFVESGAVLGDRVTLKNQVMVWDGVRIEDDAFIGPGVIFTNDAAPRSPRMPQVRGRCRHRRTGGSRLGSGGGPAWGLEPWSFPV